jgi:N-acyl-D-amino-acid deacylase
MARMVDLILRNGRIMDGSGSPSYTADVAVAADRIVAMERNLAGDGACEIDARGLVVAPGFVDIHAHSDVTTQIVGQGGFSAGPVRPENTEAFRRDSFAFSFEGYEWTWSDIAGYREALARARPAINAATLVGHGALRQYAMGQAARPPTEPEMGIMRAELAKALEQGARGLSSGLTYAPGRFSDVVELVELGKVVRRHGGVYHTHMRDYSRYLLDAIQEAVRVGEEAGIPVNLSHRQAAAPAYWGETTREATALVEGARARGVEVTWDICPWTRGGGPFLQFLPNWAQEGGFASLRRRLEDPGTRHEIARQLDEGAPDWQGWLPIPWEDQLIARTGRPEHGAWVGRTVADLAAARGLPPAETSLHLLLEDEGQYWTAPTIKSQGDINHILSHPLGVPMTDGMALAPYGPLGHPTNPRSYGTFPRVLGRYARDWGVLSMEVAVQKMTSVPARRMGIMDRGLLRPGFYADITVFDPETVIDRETFQDPHAFPAGIEYVLVNGRLIVERGNQHDVRPGHVL